MISKYWQLVPMALFIAMGYAGIYFFGFDSKVGVMCGASYILGIIYANLAHLAR